MSAFAMFSLKFPSLLQFEEEMRQNGQKRSNLNSVFGVDAVASDTQVREIIDEIDPETIRPIFRRIFGFFQRSRELERYGFIKHPQASPYYLISVDGTGYFSSHEVHCDSCLQKKNQQTGQIRYEHRMLGVSLVRPGISTVLPMAPEFIIKQDGQTKDDCELKAFYRLITKLRRDHPKLKMIMTLDSLYSCEPTIEALKNNNIKFISAVKPGKHKFLFSEVERHTTWGNAKIKEWEEEIGDKVKKKVTHRYRYIENVTLNAKSLYPKVNLVEYWEITEWESKKKGRQKKEKHFSWITDLPIKDKTQVIKIMEGGRARWKIENETFNTLKNQDYHFEHNYGHGYKNLSVNLAMLMMLAFLIDQVQEAACGIFKKALSQFSARYVLWKKIRGVYDMINLRTYSDILHILIKSRDGPIFDYDTS